MEEKKLSERLKNRRPRPIDRGRQQVTAVVIPLIREEGEWRILFEIRSQALKTQPGEVCFPGGRAEPGETPRQTALRELSEELLISPAQAEIRMESDYLVTPAGLTVYPYLAVLKDYEGTFSEDEVSRVETVPLRWFLNQEPERYSVRVVTEPQEDFPFERIPGGRDYRWREGSYDVLFYCFGELVIWGMTAKILKACMDILREETGKT